MRTTASKESASKHSSIVKGRHGSRDMVPPDFLDQAEFLQALRLEEKRAQRSGMAFGLARIEVSKFSGNLQAADSASLVDGLRLSLRDTDQCGWIVSGSTMGVIFIELPPQTALVTSEALVMDLKASLETCMPEAKALRFSVSIFPKRKEVAERRPASTEREREPLVVSRR